MIITQSPYIDDEGNVHDNLEKRYSDGGNLLLQIETGSKYDAAIDVMPCRYTYEETDEPIDSSADTDADYIEAAKVLLGEVD